MQRESNFRARFAIVRAALDFLMLYTGRKLQECLHEHGGGEVGHIWLDGDVPVFHVNFHTKLALSKLLAGQSEVEKKLMTKLQSRFYGHVLMIIFTVMSAFIHI